MFGVTKGILVQQVNCKNDMDAELAKAIYEQCPQVKEDYHNSFKEKSAEELFGTYRLIEIGNELKIANLYTQFDCTDSSKPESYGKKYTDVDAGISDIRQILNHTVYMYMCVESDKLAIEDLTGLLN